MKKYLVLLIGIMSFIGINRVSADTIVYDYSNYYINFDKYVSYYNESIDVVNSMISNWENNLSSQFPYYYITINDNSVNSAIYYINFTTCSSNETKWSYNDLVVKDSNLCKAYGYNSNTKDIIEMEDIPELYFNTFDSQFLGLMTSRGFIYNSESSNYSSILLPSFTSSVFDFSSSETMIEDGDLLYGYIDIYDGSYGNNLNNYVEINLNNYSYVILTLKDYTERDTFKSTIYVKGQLCPTTVYNYGLEEKKDYVSGYQTQSCGYYYNDFTRNIFYIKSEDIKNHAIYYLSGYDTSKPNLVKIDTSVFDITYITSENEKDPHVFIGGRDYSVLPYSDLTDTAILTEKNGVSSEWVCAKYDPDCMLNSTGLNFSDLFTKPLEMLKSVWSAITTIFAIITEFILLLPPTMQGFLYVAFSISLILGILKILL